MKKKILSFMLAGMLVAQAPIAVLAENKVTEPTTPAVTGAPAEEKKSIDWTTLTPIPEVKNVEDEVVEFGGKYDLTDNIKDLPEEAKVKDVTEKAIDTKKPGEYTGKVEVTFKDGSKRIVDVKVTVKAEDVDMKLVKAYADSIKFVNGITDGKTSIELPKVDEKYNANVQILFNGKEVAKMVVGKETKKVEVAYEKAPYTIKVSLTRLSDKVASKEVEQTIKCDFEAHDPKLNYAYVFDGGLIVNISAEMGIKEIYWAYEGETNFYKLPTDNGYGRRYVYKEKKEEKKSNDFSSLFEVHEETLDKYTRENANDYRINLDIPSVVNIVAIDKEGRKTPFTVKVEKDNTILTKSVPEDVQKMLKKAMNFTYNANNEKYNDLIVTEKNTVVDMFETFEKYIVKNLEKFNTRDLAWRFINDDKESIPYTGVYKFTKAGTFEVAVQDITTGKEAKMTVIVNDGRNNLRTYTVTDKKVEIEGDKFKAEKGLAKAIKYNEKEDINALYLIAIVDGKYYRLSDEIPFGDKTEVKATIVDLKTNKKHEVTFTRKAKAPEVTVKASQLIDISGHWAAGYIRQLVDKGIIAGYTDNTFRPENQITIKEALAILGRYAKNNEAYVNPVVADYKLVGEKDWGYEEVSYVANRLKTNIFYGQNIETETITREQVAYVMNSLFKLVGVPSSSQFTDLAYARYVNEILTLTSNGIIKGYPDGTFKAENRIKRAEFASLLFNMPAQYK